MKFLIRHGWTLLLIAALEAGLAGAAREILLPYAEAFHLRSASARIETTQELWSSQAPAQASTQPPQFLVSRVLYDLTRVSPLRERTVRMELVHDLKCNAQTDGRTIFVNQGLLQKAGNRRSVWAGILAHELAHMTAGHVRNREVRSQVSDWIYTVLDAHFSAAGDAARIFWDRFLFTLDRLEEKEADILAVMLVYRAGYDPFAMFRFFDRVQPDPKTVFTPFAVQLIPELSKYYRAAAKIKKHSRSYHKSGSRKALNQTLYWAGVAKQQEQGMSRILGSYRTSLAAVRMFGLQGAHPGIQERKKTLALVGLREMGRLSTAAVGREDRFTAEFYESLLPVCGRPTR